MRAEEIIGLMKGEVAYTGDTLMDLQNLLEEYPYFQAAQMLYTLNLRANKDSRFNAELRKTACCAGDRKKLFYWMESKSFPPEMIEKLEKKEDVALESSFDLIDFFLAGKGEKDQKPEKKTIRPEMVSTDYVSYLLSEKDGDSNTQPTPLQHQEAIDKFLEADEKAPVRIVLKETKDQDVPGENPFPNLNMIEEGSFFSETLAKIYLKQKKYTKALEIIRKLNLIYPEKNRYFADQIRFLEKLIINTKK
jgi:tetratricopeptide (TPR) repeat protein